MKARQHAAGLALVSLTLLLNACGDGSPVTPPPTGTPVTSTADSGAGSLRDLLGSAKDGDTLRLDSGTIVLSGPLKVTRSVTLDLGTSVIDASGKGRALEIASGVTVTVKGGTFRDGTGAPITLKTPSPQAQSKATYGGVLLNEGTLTLDGTAVTGGKANLGGGIANLKTGILTLTGTSSVSGNTAQVLFEELEDGSGIGGGIFNKGNVTISGGSVNMNTAFYGGGGVYGDLGSEITLNSGKVDGNSVTFLVNTDNGSTSGSAGGGMFSIGNISITGGSISGNTATYFGAGVALQSITDAQGNRVTPRLTLSGGTLENNRVTDEGRDGAGGAIWTNGPLVMTGGTVRGNSAPYGGGITVRHDASITGGTIENNQARTKNGGGLLASSPTTRSPRSTLTFGGTATVRNNVAADNSGGILVDGTILTMTGGTVTGNTAGITGGGISLSATDSTIQGGMIGNNQVSGIIDGGGGIRIFTGGRLTLSGGEISGNTTVRTGGGITSNGEIIMTGGSIRDNVVIKSANNQGGGGVRLYAGSKMTASGGTISGNKAPYGAGVDVSAPYQESPTAEFTLSGANVTGNVVTEAGNVGGGFFNEGKLLITGGSVTGNTALSNGGGVFNKKNAVYAQPGGSVTGNNPDNVFSEQ